MWLIHNKEDLMRDQDIEDKLCLEDFELDNQEVQLLICRVDQLVNRSIQISNKRKEILSNDFTWIKPN
jgi:hypothetical protein